MFGEYGGDGEEVDKTAAIAGAVEDSAFALVLLVRLLGFLSAAGSSSAFEVAGGQLGLR